MMWAYADARDVAEAHVLALDADIEEYEAFLIAQPSSRFDEPTIDLVRNNFGDRVEIRKGLGGHRQCNQHGEGTATPALETSLRLEVSGDDESDSVTWPSPRLRRHRLDRGISQSLNIPPLYGNTGCPARIRTWVRGSKGPCAATTPPGRVYRIGERTPAAD